MDITIFMAMSVDGYICGPSGETPWSHDEWENYKSHLSKSDGLIIGRRTFDVMEKAGEFEVLGNPPVIVVSRSRKHDAISAKQTVDLAKQKGWKSCIVGGGLELNTSFLKEGLTGHLHWDVEPVILGGGLRLFSDISTVQLKLISSQILSSGCMSNDYEIVR